MENKKITWYPGHMFKAKKEIQNNLKSIDLVLEVIDARVPVSSHNEMLLELTKNKERSIIFTKSDLVEKKDLEKQIEKYKILGYNVLSVNLKKPKNERQKIIGFIKTSSEPVVKKYADKDMRKNVRVLIMGMPNVGKSSLINLITGRKSTNTGNTPGVTKAQQIVKVDKDIELVDTPGILIPKIDTLERAYNLVLNSLIKDNIVELEDISFYLLKFLVVNKPSSLKKVYSFIDDDTLENIDFSDIYSIEKFYILLAKSMGISIKNNEVDYLRISNRLINDYRKQKFGKIILDKYEK